MAPPTSEESRTVTLEWKLTNLREMFEATKGDIKSKVVKSCLFGDGQWQIYFYPQSGDQYISLYLSCEPTAAERARGIPNGSVVDKSAKALEGQSSSAATDSAIEPAWQREGRFKFIFELRSVDKLTRFKCIDAADHQFSSAQSNWGWQSYAARSSIYFTNSKVKQDDAMLITCTVVYQATAPTSAPPSTSTPKSLIPSELVSAYASLFNDKDHSDVAFLIKPISASRSNDKPRKLYAIKKILSLRSEYFSVLLSGDWSEGQNEPGSPSVVRSSTNGASSSEGDISDSDVSDEDEDFASDEEPAHLSASTSDLVESDPPAYANDTSLEGTATPPTADEEVSRSVYNTPSRRTARQRAKGKRGQLDRMSVTVTDASYKTFKSLLYYLYTDSIVFAPLASTYRAAKETARSLGSTFPYESRSDFCRAHAQSQHVEGLVKQDTLQTDMANAKEVYILADKLGLPDLKARAFAHIQQSLSESTVAYEVFSPFSQHYEEIQNLQRTYLLDHWKEVRTSLAMKTVFAEVQQKATSRRYPAFSEVFAQLLSVLEVVAPAANEGVLNVR